MSSISPTLSPSLYTATYSASRDAAVTTQRTAGSQATSTSTVRFSSAAMSALEAADTTAPTVTMFTPADGSEGAARSANIVLKFDEAVQRGSGVIQIKDARGRTVESIDVRRSPRVKIEGDTVTIDPRKDLSYDTRYTVSIAKGSFKDAAGNGYAGTKTYDFKTQADTDGPVVTRFSPADGSGVASTTANISLRFDESISRGTGKITLRDELGNTIEAIDVSDTQRVSVKGNVLSINPSNDFRSDTRYLVSIDPGAVTDRKGNAFAGEATYDFRTRRDTTAPKVSALTPPARSSGLALNADITIKFNEAVRLGSGTITLKDARGRTVESFDASNSARLKVDGDTLTINPSANLAASSRYSITVNRGAVQDIAGNNFAGLKSYSFRTGTDSIPEDLAAPTIASAVPVNGATRVDKRSNIELTFSETVERGQGRLLLKDSQGAVVETFDAATSDRLVLRGNTLILDPTADLADGKRYSLEIEAGAFKDLAGNAFAGTTGYGFSVGEAPVVSAFKIDVLYSGDSRYQGLFDQAAALWQQVIVGDLPDINGVDDIRISASVTLLDGAFGRLAEAGPRLLRPTSGLPFDSEMKFDSADMDYMAATGTLFRVILHEMGHALGLGALWGQSGFNNKFQLINPSQNAYIGSAGVAAYRQLSGNAGAAFVPLEATGGPGTVNAHWSEAVFDNELMTGFSENSPNMPLSRLTIAGMADLGYVVNYGAAENYALPSLPTLRAGLSAYA